MLPQVSALLESLAAHLARVAPVAAVDAQDVRLDVTVAREQLEADAAGVLVANIKVVQLGVVVMLLES